MFLKSKKAANAKDGNSGTPSSRNSSSPLTPESNRKKKAPAKKKGGKNGSPRDVTSQLNDATVDSGMSEEAAALFEEALAPLREAPSAEKIAPAALPVTTAKTWATCNLCTFKCLQTCKVCPRCNEPIAATASRIGKFPVAAAASTPPAAPAIDAAAYEAQRCVATAMALNRCLVRANERVKKFNFDLDSLVGFDMQNVTIGVVGDGDAAPICSKLMGAFGGTVVSKPAGATDLAELYAKADILAFHPAKGAPPILTAATLVGLKPSVMILAPSVACDMEALVSALETKQIRHVGCLDEPALSAELSTRFSKLPTAIVPGVTAVSAASAASEAVAKPEPVVAGDMGDGAMRIAFYSSRSYFSSRFAESAVSWNSAPDVKTPVRFEMHSARLDTSTAEMAAGCKAVCLFVNDECGADVLAALKAGGVELVLMRCAGFDKVDLKSAEELGIKVVRVPAYSPEAVAQQAVALLLTLKWQLAASGATNAPLGLDLTGTTVGVLGTGRIGYLFAMVMQGFGCNVIAYDPYKNKAIEEAGIPYVSVDEVYEKADIISLHVPLLPATKYMINEEAIGKMRKGVTLLNVSRGALVDTAAVTAGLGNGQIGFYGTDVYEHEAAFFFDDHSGEEISDGTLKKLLGMPTAMLTGHQAFLTNDALSQIVGTTIKNISQFLDGSELQNQVKAS